MMLTPLLQAISPVCCLKRPNGVRQVAFQRLSWSVPTNSCDPLRTRSCGSGTHRPGTWLDNAISGAKQLSSSTSRFRHCARFLHASQGHSMRRPAQFNPVAKAFGYFLNNRIAQLTEGKQTGRKQFPKPTSQATTSFRHHYLSGISISPSRYRVQLPHSAHPDTPSRQHTDCEAATAHCVPPCRSSQLTRPLDRPETAPQTTTQDWLQAGLSAAIRGSTPSTQPDSHWQASPMLARAI
jgi:hypothetical protein